MILGEPLGNFPQFFAVHEVEPRLELRRFQDLEKGPGTIFHVEAEFLQNGGFGFPQAAAEAAFMAWFQMEVHAQAWTFLSRRIKNRAEACLVRRLEPTEAHVAVDTVKPKGGVVAAAFKPQRRKQAEEEGFNFLFRRQVVLTMGLEPLPVVVLSERAQEREACFQHASPPPVLSPFRKSTTGATGSPERLG